MSRYPGNIIIKNPATPTGPNPLTGRAPGIWRMDEVAYWRQRGLWPDASADPYFNYVSLLLSTTSLGNANNNLFVDSSGAFNPISRTGNTTQGSFTPYGSLWSWNFSGVSSRYFLINASSAFALGTGDFTIEAWFQQSAKSFNFPRFLNLGPSNWDTTDSSALIINGNTYPGKISFETYSGIAVPSTTTIQSGVWYHVAVTRSGNTFRIFVNGVLENTVTSSAAVTTSSTVACRVGGGGYNNDSFNGNTSNMRLVKGTALYTSNFTPSTTPLTAVSGTSLLTCQSNRFIDNSSNAFTMTPSTGQNSPSTVSNDFSNTTHYSPFAPAYPGIIYNQSDIQYWSGYFLNTTSGNRLQWAFPGSAVQNAVAGTNYTIEFWVYRLPKTNTFQCMFSTENDRNNILLDASGNVYITSNGGTAMFSGFSANTYIPTYQWTHVALVCSGTTWTLYFNGTSYGTYSGASKTSYGTGNAQLGARNDMDGCGYMSNFRVSTTARYSGNFTPSTTPFTTDANTAMLTLQSAAFTDVSANNQSFTVVSSGGGQPTVTGNNPFQAGYYSGYFDGSGDYLTVPYSTGLQFPGDFTVECWVFPIARVSTYPCIVNNYSTYTTNGGFAIFAGHGSANTSKYNVAFNGSFPVIQSTSDITYNAWSHIALVRSGSTITLYVNGVANGTATSSATVTGTANSWWVGTAGDAVSGGEFNGYISNLRAVKGAAVYTSAFTPSTTPLTAISGTGLLTCQSGRFIDNSSNNATITVNGNTSVQPFDPFYTSTIASNGGSMYFDGTGDYLRGANGPAFQFGTGDFTVEMWAYFMDPSATNRPLFDNGATSNTGRLLIRQGNDAGTANVVNAFVSGTTASSPTIQFYSWTHVAVVRQSGTVKIYINGVGGTGVTATADLSQNACLLGAFYDSLAANFTGYMSNVRVTKGTAIYTANFTPPTAPVTPTAATTLLVNGMNAGAYDATAINDMETVGNAQVSTAQSKFGGSSVYFDGSGDYLVAPSSPAYAFGTGNFTLEGWFYPTASANQALFEMRNSTTSTSGIAVRLLSSSNTLRVIMNNTALFTTSTAVSLNQWSHIAVVRSSGTVTAYLNGVAMTGGSASGSTSLTDNTLWIGELRDGSFQWNGYMDDLRITKGVARYTANFTPPTQAFPTY